MSEISFQYGDKGELENYRFEVYNSGKEIVVLGRRRPFKDTGRGSSMRVYLSQIETIRLINELTNALIEQGTEEQS